MWNEEQFNHIKRTLNFKCKYNNYFVPFKGTDSLGAPIVMSMEESLIRKLLEILGVNSIQELDSLKYEDLRLKSFLLTKRREDHRNKPEYTKTLDINSIGEYEAKKVKEILLLNLGEEVVNLSNLGLKEFEETFTEKEISKMGKLLEYYPDEKYTSFQYPLLDKEISLKYGTPVYNEFKDKSEDLKKISSEDFEIGGIYLDKNNRYWAYIGKGIVKVLVWNKLLPDDQEVLKSRTGFIFAEIKEINIDEKELIEHVNREIEQEMGKPKILNIVREKSVYIKVRQINLKIKENIILFEKEIPKSSGKLKGIQFTFRKG